MAADIISHINMAPWKVRGIKGATMNRVFVAGAYKGKEYEGSQEWGPNCLFKDRSSAIFYAKMIVVNLYNMKEFDAEDKAKRV